MFIVTRSAFKTLPSTHTVNADSFHYPPIINLDHAVSTFPRVVVHTGLARYILLIYTLKSACCCRAERNRHACDTLADTDFIIKKGICWTRILRNNSCKANNSLQNTFALLQDILRVYTLETNVVLRSYYNIAGIEGALQAIRVAAWLTAIVVKVEECAANAVYNTHIDYEFEQIQLFYGVASAAALAGHRNKRILGNLSTINATWWTFGTSQVLVDCRGGSGSTTTKQFRIPFGQQVNFEEITAIGVV